MMFKDQMSVREIANVFIAELDSQNDKILLNETPTGFVMTGDRARQLIEHTYRNAPDLNTALEAFTVMCAMFNHYGADEKTCQNWFEYNVQRWCAVHRVSKKVYKKTVRQYA